MCFAQGPQRSDAGEARTRGSSVSSQALNQRATTLHYTSNITNDLGEGEMNMKRVLKRVATKITQPE